MFGIGELLAVALAFFIVTVSPGPANIAVATVSMGAGRRAGIAMGLGLGAGLGIWGIVAATGMGAVLQGSAHLLLALKLLGGVYLIWLAIQSGRAALSPGRAEPKAPGSGRWFRRGLILNLSNPKAVVAWMAALSMGLGQGDGAAQVALATVVCVTLGFLNYAGYAVLFSVPGAMALYRRIGRWVDGAVAGLFAVAGFGLIRSALSR